MNSASLGSSLYSLGADPTESIVSIVIAQQYLDCCLLIRCGVMLFTESLPSNECLLRHSCVMSWYDVGVPQHSVLLCYKGDLIYQQNSPIAYHLDPCTLCFLPFLTTVGSARNEKHPLYRGLSLDAMKERKMSCSHQESNLDSSVIQCTHQVEWVAIATMTVSY
jgi:hypothetical protein